MQTATSLKAQRAAQKAAKQMKQIQRQVKKPTATVWKLNRAQILAIMQQYPPQARI